MIKWLLLSALAMNLLAFFWFASTVNVLSEQETPEDLRQKELAGEIVLLSELDVVPPTRQDPAIGGQKDEKNVQVDVVVQEVTLIEPLPTLGSVELQADGDRRLEPEVSQQAGGGDLKKKGLVKKAFLEPMPQFEEQAELAPELECVTLGGFDKELDAIGVLEKLEKMVGVAAKVNTVVERWVRYLVYIPPFETRGMAKEMQAELKEAGMRSSLYYKGDLKNGLSLGYFGSRRNAERRYKHVLAAGYGVEQKAVETKRSRYWIELEVGDDAKLSQQFWRDMAEKFPNAATEKIKCSDID